MCLSSKIETTVAGLKKILEKTHNFIAKMFLKIQLKDEYPVFVFFSTY